MTTITTTARLLSTASLTWRSGLFGEPPRIVSNRNDTQFASVVGGETVYISAAHLTGVAVTLDAGNISASAIIDKINSVLNTAYGTAALNYAAATGQTFYLTDPISSSQLQTSASTANDYEKLGLSNLQVDNTLGSRPGVDVTQGTWYDQISEPVTVPSGSTHMTLHVRYQASTSTPVSATLAALTPTWDVAGYGGPPPYTSGSLIIVSGIPGSGIGSMVSRLSASLPRPSSDFGDFNNYLPNDPTGWFSYLAPDPLIMLTAVGSSDGDAVVYRLLELPVPLGADRFRLAVINIQASGSRSPCALSASVAFGARYFDR